jgi:hypothetical protein
MKPEYDNDRPEEQQTTGDTLAEMWNGGPAKTIFDSNWRRQHPAATGITVLLLVFLLAASYKMMSHPYGATNDAFGGLICFSIVIGVVAAILGLIVKSQSKTKKKSEVLQLLHASAPAGFTITDEQFGEDQEAAIAIDRNTGRFLLWQKQANCVRLCPIGAVRTIEYCENGSVVSVGIGAPIAGFGVGSASSIQKVRNIQLRLELTDVNNPYVSLCFLDQQASVGLDHPWYRKASPAAREWKARLEAIKLKNGPETEDIVVLPVPEREASIPPNSHEGSSPRPPLPSENEVFRSEIVALITNVKNGTASLGRLIVSANQLISKQLSRWKLRRLTLPRCFQALGEQTHKAGSFREDFSYNYQVSDAVLVELTAIQAKSTARPKAEHFADRMKAQFVILRDLVATKWWQFKLKRSFTNLGRVVYEKHGEQSGPTELVTPIVNADTRQSFLDADIHQLSESRPGQILTPKRIAFGEILGVALILIAILIRGGVNSSSSPVRQSGELGGGAPETTKSVFDVPYVRQHLHTNATKVIATTTLQDQETLAAATENAANTGEVDPVLVEMLRAGRIFYVPSGTAVGVITSVGTCTEVHVLEGASEGRDVWVLSEVVGP